MKRVIKRRDIFLFLSFVVLFVLFAIFQNFSFPTNQLQQITNKEFFRGKLYKFVPTYTFKNYIGHNQEIEAPYGYKEEISRRIASVDGPVVFDDKKFLKEGIKALPVYKNLKNVIDISDNNESGTHCINNPIEPQNNCFVEYEGERSKPNSAKFKTNPFRQTASVILPGETVDSKMLYDMDRNSVNVQFTKSLDKDTGLKLELDSQEQSGTINIDVRW